MSHGGDLYMLSGKKWHKYGRAEGFPPNTTFFLAEDNAGYLWSAGIRGIIRAPLAEMRQVLAGQARQVHAEMVLN